MRLTLKSHTKIIFIAFAFAVALNLNATRNINAQTSTANREQGIALINKGDYAAAIKPLRAATKADKSDADAWHNLGIAFKLSDKKSDARKAFERAYELRRKLALQAVYPPTKKDENQDSSKATNQLLVQKFDFAIESFNQLITVDKNAQQNRALEFELLCDLADQYRNETTIYKVCEPNEVDVKAVLLSSSEPLYTEKARTNGVQGKVVLRVVLSPDGKVRYPMIIASLPHGLTEESIRAALTTRFTPARKDGRAVPTYATLTYTFNVY